MHIIYAILSALQGLPNWIRWVFVVLSLAVTMGLSSFFDSKVAIIGVLGLIGVGLLIGVFWGWVQKRKEAKAAGFAGELQQQSGTAPGEISDPARRARLEDLRRNFEKGIATFKAAGKNLYDVPWYVIVGEPGAGKTEAIRHSSVGFPPGMQDEFQGVGGTINMNWWFTNDAVILDTAGRLLFEEIEPGTTGEWRVFLEMLKKYRPNCPINGLLLAIPAESLIKDNATQLQKKAGRIAQQLETIQKQLDVRFPAYVVITKADLLNGFREFFDDLTDATAQQQMMGWSNPDPLDAPFRPALVDEHLHTVVQRLRRRRQGLMIDPVARTTERRTDEVDRMFSFPHSVSLIAANLRTYLETIFSVGTWTLSPLFLRGIYFTSSLREGSALDQELANALGVDVEALPEGKAWETERSYFLRDLFLEKTFRERGLVTRATDTTKLVRNRRLTLLGAGTAGLLLLFGFSWLGYNSLRSSIGMQAGHWARASEDWNSDHSWRPVVQRDVGQLYLYKGNEKIGPGTTDRARLLFRDSDAPLERFHSGLGTLASKSLEVPFIFRPLTRIGGDIDRERKRAQRVVYEGGVFKPLVDAARAKISDPSPDPGARAEVPRQREVDALLALIRLEAGIVKRNEKLPLGTFNGDKLVPPLLIYTTGGRDEGELTRMVEPTYAGASGSAWPPDWISGGSSLAENQPIDIGLNRFIGDARQVLQTRVDGLPMIIKAIEEIRQFARFENELYTASKAKAQLETSDAAVNASFNGLIDKVQTVNTVLDQAAKAGLFENGVIRLSDAYGRLFGVLRARYDAARAIEDEINLLLPAANVTALQKAAESVVGEKREHVLFREIREKLKPILAELEGRFKGTLTDTELAELKTIDEYYLADPVTSDVRFRERWKLYDVAMKATKAVDYAQKIDLVGTDWKALTEMFERVAEIRRDVQKYKGSLSEKAISIAGYCLTRAERVHSEQFTIVYLKQAREKLSAQLRFPLAGNFADAQSWLKPDELVSVVNLVEHVKHDLESPTFQAIVSPYKQPLIELRKNVSRLDPIIQALVTKDKHLRPVTVFLMSRTEQFRLSGQQVGMEAFKGIELRVGTIDHAIPVQSGAKGRISSETASDLELARFTLYEPFHFHFYRSLSDANLTADLPAPTNWTSLRMLDQQNARRIGDGRRWQFALQPANGKLFWIEFRFEEPFPEIVDWPTLSILGLENRRRP